MPLWMRTGAFLAMSLGGLACPAYPPESPVEGTYMQIEGIVECYDKLAGCYTDYTLGACQLAKLTADAVNATYAVVKTIITPDWCSTSVEMLCYAVNELGLTTGLAQDPYPTPEQPPNPADETRRDLQAGFVPDVDPNNVRFTSLATKSNYATYTRVAAGTCEPSSPNGCSADARGNFLIAYENAKASARAAEIAKALVNDAETVGCLIPLNPLCPGLVGGRKTAVLAAVGATELLLEGVERVKAAQDFVQATINGVKNGVTSTNIKSVLLNQAQETSRADQVNQQVTATQQLLTGLAQTITTQLNNINTVLSNNVLRLGTNIATVLSNTELRITNTLINAILNKFSIGGSARPGQLVVPPQVTPPPLAAVRRLEAGAEYQEFAENTTTPEIRELQITDANFLYGYGCDGNDNDNNGAVDECNEDKFGPIIRLDASFAGARDVWFTDTARLTTFVTNTAVGRDDCGLVTFAPPVVSGTCKNTAVGLTATDRCGNRAQATLPVWLDAQAPTVDFKLKPNAKFVLKRKPLILKEKDDLVNLGVTQLAINDDCDATPYVQITVYSDERDIDAEKERKPLAVLSRVHDAKGALTGWRVYVVPQRAEKCDDLLEEAVCDVADGRVYTVRICARDQAGNVQCKDRTAGVSVKHDKPTATSQGKLFVVAHDAAYFRRASDDITEAFDPNNFANHS